jgi:putative intracellular protease/amidase
MNALKSGTALLALLVAIAAPMTSHAAQSATKGQVLVVMSGAHLLNLQDGKVYATGYYLNELATPLNALINAGYTPVFASPNGDAPTMDASSNNAKFFGGDDAKRMETLKFVDGFQGLRHPLKLSAIAGHTQNYVGVFVPGGHAPMVDLVKDKNLGRILLSFHDAKRPTALICHGPMALLSTLPQSEKFDEALVAGDTASLSALAHGWPYAGYKVTVFSKAEEQQIEEPQLGGRAPYYNDEALAAAGAQIQNADSWKPNVVVDREVVTAQQPFSDTAFADAFVAKLDKASK